MTGRPLPPGWLGKPHACHQLARAARVSDVLVFVDADVQLAPHAVRAAVGLLDRHALDFVSPYPRQLAGSVAERIVQPLLQWSWLTFLPLRLAEHARRPSMAVANGQFLAVRRAAYERAGGHAAVRAAVLDDVALARELRRHGARGGVVDGTGLGACRMYDGWVDLRDGYAKSLWAAFGSEPGAMAVLVLLVVMYLVPPIAMVRGQSWAPSDIWPAWPDGCSRRVDAAPSLARPARPSGVGGGGGRADPGPSPVIGAVGWPGRVGRSRSRVNGPGRCRGGRRRRAGGGRATRRPGPHGQRVRGVRRGRREARRHRASDRCRASASTPGPPS